MLVDNSIVMLENIFRHREEGQEDVEEAAHEGAAEVQSAVVASTRDQPGRGGAVPAHHRAGGAHLPGADPHHLLRDPGVPGRGAHRGADAVGAARQDPLLQRRQELARRASWTAACCRLRTALPAAPWRAVVRFRWAVLGVAAAALSSVFFLARGLGSEFLPQVDDGNVGVMISLAPGVSALETNRITLEVEDMIADDARRAGALRHRGRLPLRRLHEPAVGSGLHRHRAGAGVAAIHDRRRVGAAATGEDQRAGLPRRAHLRAPAPHPGPAHVELRVGDRPVDPG